MGIGWIVKCSKCGRKLKPMGSVVDDFRHVIMTAGTREALEQWEGTVCISCQLIFCPRCLRLNRLPWKCPECGEVVKPAVAKYLVEPLSKASEDKSPNLSDTAARALEMIKINTLKMFRFVKGLRKSKQKSNKKKRSTAYNTVEETNKKQVQPKVTKGKKSTQRTVRIKKVKRTETKSRFIDNGDGTLTDTLTNLQWQKEDDGIMRNYKDAQHYTKGICLAGYKDWRLPQKEELIELAKFGYKNLKQFFPNIKSERYWTYTTSEELYWAQNPDKIAYTVDFDPRGNYGADVTYFRSYEYYVRSVRDTEPMTKKIIEMESLLRSESENVRFNAAHELAELGIEAVPILLKALKDDRKGVSQNAIHGIIMLMNRSEDIGEERLRETLKPATKYLINIVERAKISSGVNSFTEYVSSAIGALGIIGDPIAIPTLKKILAKVQKKIEKEGVSSEYVETESYAGYTSTEEDVYHINHSIEQIRKKS
jgi:hypothetical protein